MFLRWKRWAAAAGTGLCLIAGPVAAGAAPVPSTSASSTTPAAPSPAAPAAPAAPALLDLVAGQLGIPAAKLEAAVRAAELARWNAFAKAHKVPAAKVAEVASRISKEPLTLRARFGQAQPRTGILPAAASYLGLTPQALRAELAAGKTLADVAGTQKKSVDGLKAALTTAMTAELDRRIDEGRIDAAARDALLAKWQGKLDELVQARFRGPAPGSQRSLAS